MGCSSCQKKREARADSVSSYNQSVKDAKAAVVTRTVLVNGVEVQPKEVA